MDCARTPRRATRLHGILIGWKHTVKTTLPRGAVNLGATPPFEVGRNFESTASLLPDDRSHQIASARTIAGPAEEVINHHRPAVRSWRLVRLLDLHVEDRPIELLFDQRLGGSGLDPIIGPTIDLPSHFVQMSKSGIILL